MRKKLIFFVVSDSCVLQMSKEKKVFPAPVFCIRPFQKGVQFAWAKTEAGKCSAQSERSCRSARSEDDIKAHREMQLFIMHICCELIVFTCRVHMLFRHTSESNELSLLWQELTRWTVDSDHIFYKFLGIATVVYCKGKDLYTEQYISNTQKRKASMEKKTTTEKITGRLDPMIV